MDGADAIVVALFRDQQLAQFRKTKPFDSFYWTLPSLILSLFHYFSNFLSFSLSLFLWYFLFLSLNVFLSLSFDASAYLFLLPPNLTFDDSLTLFCLHISSVFSLTYYLSLSFAVSLTYSSCLCSVVCSIGS